LHIEQTIAQEHRVVRQHVPDRLVEGFGATGDVAVVVYVQQ
jgi:hypothetical protein